MSFSVFKVSYFMANEEFQTNKQVLRWYSHTNNWLWVTWYDTETISNKTTRKTKKVGFQQVYIYNTGQLYCNNIFIHRLQ